MIPVTYTDKKNKVKLLSRVYVYVYVSQPGLKHLENMVSRCFSVMGKQFKSFLASDLSHDNFVLTVQFITRFIDIPLNKYIKCRCAYLFASFRINITKTIC